MPKTRFHHLLEIKLKELVESRSLSLGDGAAHDYAQYREQVGFIQGLTTAMKLCDELEQEFSNGSNYSE